MGKGKSETRDCCDCGEQGHVGVNCPYKWTNSIVEENDPVSSWEIEPEGDKAEDLASLETPDDEREWCRPRRNRITRWEKSVDPRVEVDVINEVTTGREQRKRVTFNCNGSTF